MPDDVRRFDMTLCVATAYRLGSGVFACLYEATADQHLPFAGPIAADWALSSWAIIPDAGSEPIYALVLVSPSPAEAKLPDAIIIDSSFGLRQLLPKTASGPLPTMVIEPLARAILSIAGRQDPDLLSRLLSAVAALAWKGDSLPERLARLDTDGGRRTLLHIAGPVSGTYVAARDGAVSFHSRIGEIRYSGQTEINTTLALDHPVEGNAVWLLGDGSFEALTIVKDVQ